MRRNARSAKARCEILRRHGWRWQEMKESLPEAGPWFTTRVMQAIAAQEEEIEERQNGFWTSVRRLAPRLVAFATLLLMLGGTWAFQERRAARANGPQMGPAEGIFEAVPSCAGER